MQVELDPWEYEHALSIGARRFVANWGKRDASYYDKKLMEDNRTAQAAACVGELAVAKITNQYWPGHVWHKSDHKTYRHRPDVGHNIEVRRVRTSLNAAVRRHQVGKGLVLFVAQAIPPEFREVQVLGWIDMDEAWEKGVPSDYDSESTRLISPTHLTPVRGGD